MSVQETNTQSTAADDPASEGDKGTNRQGLKLAVELGPLLIFFLGNSYYGIFAATGAFMAATVVSLIASKLLFKRIPVMPLVTGVFVMFFGGLTLFLQNDTFIKLKPTIVNSIFGVVMLGGVYFKQIFWKYLFGDAFSLTDEGWRQLQIRWGCFFLFLALVNEIVWRNFSTDFWVSFKVFGVMPLTFVFAMSLIPLMYRYHPEGENQEADATLSSNTISGED